MLCNNNVALKYRLRLLISCVLSPMYWRAGSWILTRTQCTHLRAVQDHMLRKMIYVPRSSEESTESYMARWSRLLRNCRSKHKILHGDETCFAEYFSWCRHNARLATRDPARETSKMFLNENMTCLRNLKEELGTQCHGRRFRVWRWEQAAAQCIGDDWTVQAQSTTGWRANPGEMIGRRKTKVGGSKLCYNGMTFTLVCAWFSSAWYVCIMYDVVLLS